MSIPVISIDPNSIVMIEVGVDGLSPTSTAKHIKFIRGKFRRVFPKNVSLLMVSNDNHSEVLIKTVIQMN